MDAVVLMLGVVVCLASLGRQVPPQNIALAVGLAAVIGSLAHGLSAQPTLAIPFGPVFFQADCGDKILAWVPWPIPFLWIAALFSSRGTARLVLRPWRKLKSYGYWLIGLTAVLMMLFDTALEPFATGARHLWSWQATKIPLTWYGASPLNFLSWGLVTLLILAFATPALIKKKPGSRSPLDVHPLVVWLGALILFGAGSARAGLWPAAAADGVMILLVLGFAVPGARW